MHSTVFMANAAKICDMLDVSKIEQMLDVLIAARNQNGRLFILGVGGIPHLDTMHPVYAHFDCHRTCLIIVLIVGCDRTLWTSHMCNAVCQHVSQRCYVISHCGG